MKRPILDKYKESDYNGCRYEAYDAYVNDLMLYTDYLEKTMICHACAERIARVMEIKERK